MIFYIPIGIIDLSQTLRAKAVIRIDNRELLLDAALDLFYAKGYDAVGVQEIVDRAGVTKPTLYYYFGSKIGLLQNLLERGYRVLEKGVLEATRMKANLPEVLYKVAREFFDYAADHQKFYLFMLALFYSGQIGRAHV